jgi:hypothetical protein
VRSIVSDSITIARMVLEAAKRPPHDLPTAIERGGAALWKG